MADRVTVTETRAEIGEALAERWRLATADGRINELEMLDLGEWITRNATTWGVQATECRMQIAFMRGGLPALDNYDSQVNKIARGLRADGYPAIEASAA